jgi:hypothetical protein
MIPMIAALQPGRIPSLFGALCALAFSFIQVQAAPDSSDASGCQLNIELRDGSRAVGKSLEDTLSFHSSTVGDMKLSWAGIRSIEFAGTNTSVARLTATNGDVLNIQIAGGLLHVKTGFGQSDLPLKLIRNLKVTPPPRPPSTGPETARLTIELWDGSAVAGKSVEDTLNFHTTAAGDLKLAWPCIRSIEYSGTNTELARLTETNGEVYEGQYAGSSVGVITGFGKSELRVELIRSIKVSMVGDGLQMPPGLVASWAGDGNAMDSAGANNGTLNGAVMFTNIGVAQAFSFQGGIGYVSVPHSPLWDFGSNPFTIAFWANFNEPTHAEALIADDNGYGLGQNKWCLCHGTQGNTLTFHIAGPAVENVGNVPFLPVTGKWYHIAVTREGSDWTFYTNGVVAGTAKVSIAVPSTAAALTIGNAENQAFFNGFMCEVSIYNRALSEAEVETLYHAGKWLTYWE